MPTVRKLNQKNKNTLEKFLLSHIDSSLILLDNLRKGGITHNGDKYSSDFYGAFVDGKLAGVVAHTWNHNLVLQTKPELLVEIVPYLLKNTDRPVGGILGPSQQTSKLTELLITDRNTIQLDSDELLFSLQLDQMKLPRELTNGDLTARPLEESDLPFYLRWCLDYATKTLRKNDSEQLRKDIHAAALDSIQEQTAWVLFAGDEAVSTCLLTVQTQEAVQIGRVWTPPAHRSRGYGRSVIAACLYQLWRGAVPKAVLFTNHENIPAIRSYSALGFEQVGDYRLTFFHTPIRFQV